MEGPPRSSNLKGDTMKPVSPVIPGAYDNPNESNLNAPGCEPLPCLRFGANKMSRWHLSWWERIWVLLKGDIYLCVVGGHPPAWLDVDWHETQEAPRILRALRWLARVGRREKLSLDTADAERTHSHDCEARRCCYTDDDGPCGWPEGEHGPTLPGGKFAPGEFAVHNALGTDTPEVKWHSWRPYPCTCGAGLSARESRLREIAGSDLRIIRLDEFQTKVQ